MKLNFHLNKVFKFITFSVFLSSFVLIPYVNAAGVSVALTTSAVNVSSTGTITLAYTSTVAVTASDNIKLSLNTAYTGTPTFTINATAATSTNATSGSIITYTLTPGATVATGSVSIVISGLTTPSTAGNYTFSILTSTGDFGAVLQYVGQSNIVSVTAQVLPILSFAVRNNADTANINTCNLGNLSITQVSTCDYRLKVTTNSASGYIVSVKTSGNLTSPGHDMVNAAAGSGGTGGNDISNGTSGTERYGVVVTPGATTTSSTVTLASAYNGGSNAVSYINTSAATLLTSSGANAPATSGDTTNTTLVSHKSNINTATGSGFYTQTVTYTVVASF